MSIRPRLAAATLAVAAALAVVSRPTHAQIAYDGEHARVEVLGLHRWTLRMLRDSIAHYVPGETLESAACMVILRDSLHFADASVDRLIFGAGPGPQPKPHLTIKVAEPGDRTGARWTGVPASDDAALRPGYASLVVAASDSDGRVLEGALVAPAERYHADSAARAPLLANPRWHDYAVHVWSFLDEHRTDADWRTALRVLRTDPLPANRVVAALVLTNFADRDSSWWALTDALRDRSVIVRETASSVLGRFPTRDVDWAPVAPALRALVNGTNLQAMGMVHRTLAATHVAPTLAPALLRGEGTWLLRMLQAEDPMGRPAAHALLVQLNGGRDLGDAAAPWARWIRTL